MNSLLQGLHSCIVGMKREDPKDKGIEGQTFLVAVEIMGTWLKLKGWELMTQIFFL